MILNVVIKEEGKYQWYSYASTEKLKYIIMGTLYRTCTYTSAWAPAKTCFMLFQTENSYIYKSYNNDMAHLKGVLNNEITTYTPT